MIKWQQRLAFPGEALHFHDNRTPLCLKKGKAVPKQGIIKTGARLSIWLIGYGNFLLGWDILRWRSLTLIAKYLICMSFFFYFMVTFYCIVWKVNSLSQDISWHTERIDCWIIYSQGEQCQPRQEGWKKKSIAIEMLPFIKVPMRGNSNQSKIKKKKKCTMRTKV